ncbi:MAG: hypothetical protein E3J21_17500 [Anaerolineales bacterium]|nr:MAG: hypothetical protein E3J21_17500 [Anaerolineales bacterium]
MKTQDKYHQLAIKYAPIFAQKVSREWRVADQIAPVDFAGPITDVAKNPEKLHGLDDKAVIPAKVYYSVCETTTHYFLIYAVYHVLDWWKRYEAKDLYNSVRDMLDEHIHDMEGALLVVTKDPKARVDGLVTISHLNFYLYTEPRIPTNVGEARRAFRESLRIVKFNETVDGNIWLDQATKRVKLYIQSRGHGIRGDHKGWGGGEEIWYYGPEEETAGAGTLDPQAKKHTRTVKYQLEDIFADKGLWGHRFDNKVFRQNKNGQWGFVYREKNKLRGGAANPPWSWNDHNDPSPIGEVASDPARFITRYAQGWGPVSTHYIYNPYQLIEPSS